MIGSIKKTKVNSFKKCLKKQLEGLFCLGKGFESRAGIENCLTVSKG